MLGNLSNAGALVRDLSAEMRAIEAVEKRLRLEMEIRHRAEEDALRQLVRQMREIVSDDGGFDDYASLTPSDLLRELAGVLREGWETSTWLTRADACGWEGAEAARFRSERVLAWGRLCVAAADWLEEEARHLEGRLPDQRKEGPGRA